MGFARPFSHVQIWSRNPSGPSSPLSRLRSSSSSSSSCCRCGRRRRRRSRESLALPHFTILLNDNQKEGKTRKNNTSCSSRNSFLSSTVFENSGCSRFDALKSSFSERKLKCFCFWLFFFCFVFPMICCCCWWPVLLGTGNRSARSIEISKFFIFLYFIRLEKTFGFDFSGGRKASRKKKITSRAKLLGFWTTTTAYKEREREENERERVIMPHWWTPCVEAYPIRMPERTPPRIRSDQTESAVEPQFVKAMPLREVVADCEKRWFEQTLKAAKNGDVAMQSLVGQMFCSGYGVTANLKKGKLWLQKAAESDMEARSLLASLSGLEKTKASNLHQSKQT